MDDYTKDMDQIERVAKKLVYMQRYSPDLVQLEPPAGRQWLEFFEEDGKISLPWDYRGIITGTADGGYVPDVCNSRHWRPLQETGEACLSLDVPYPPAEKEEALRGYWVDISDAVSLSGQIFLMGNRNAGWSLITAGPCAGEVWTVKDSAVIRVPGCSFAQWLELVLDQNLEAYINVCLAGEDSRTVRACRFGEMPDNGAVWQEGENPMARCAQWLEQNRFVYEGPSPGWAEYLRGHVHSVLALLPQERDEGLAALRAAQKAPDWKWGRPRAAVMEQLCGHGMEDKPAGDRIRWEDPEEMARLGRMIQAVWKEEEEESGAEISPEDRVLFDQAQALARGKRFQQRGAGIRDLSFLEGLTGLKELDLWDNDIEDLSPLASLTGLRQLSLPYNLISDLSPLAGLEKLVELRVYGNQIASLEPLRGLHNLNVLNLRGNPLEPGALSCLRKCKRLGMLNLSYTGLKDLKDLEFCRVWNLDLYGNPDLEGLEVLSTMKRLSCLYLDTRVAHRYNIKALAPQLIEHVELGGISLYVWPEKYYN